MVYNNFYKVSTNSFIMSIGKTIAEAADAYRSAIGNLTVRLETEIRVDIVRRLASLLPSGYSINVESSGPRFEGSKVELDLRLEYQGKPIGPEEPEDYGEVQQIMAPGSMV